jgi:uroporphyrinogen-III synthase
MRVLVTRPQPDAARTAARLNESGHDAIVDPLLSIAPVTIGKLPVGPYAGLAATSANAVRVASATVEFDSLRTTPIYAVGTHTADTARDAGFETVVVAGGDGAALAELLSARLPSGARVLHLAGEDRSRELAGLLSRAGIIVEVIVLYRARPTAALAPATVGALSQRKVDAVLHFSPRTAATFVALAERHGLADAARRPRHLCLSLAVAQELTPLGVSAECAAQPTEADLVALLGL